MKYCAIENLPRLFKHLWVNDKKERQKILKQYGANYPFLIDAFKEVEDFSFQLVGDSGEGDQSQNVLIEELERMPQRYPNTKFMIMLGDIVYPDGSASDYAQRFFYPYRNYPFPIYAITGNHDWYSKLNGFRRHFLNESSLARQFGRPSVHQPNIYFFIETRRLRIICLDSGKTGKKIDQQQMHWFHEVCQKEPRDIEKLLLLHHPLYCEDRRQKIAKQLEPLVQQYGIRLVITAHVHNYQKYSIKYADSGHKTMYIVSGAGGAGLTPTDKLARRRFVEDFYPSVEESHKKFKKILGIFSPPAWLTSCKDSYPYYKSFLNISLKQGILEVTVFKKRGFAEPAEEVSFSI